MVARSEVGRTTTTKAKTSNDGVQIAANAVMTKTKSADALTTGTWASGLNKTENRDLGYPETRSSENADGVGGMLVLHYTHDCGRGDARVEDGHSRMSSTRGSGHSPANAAGGGENVSVVLRRCYGARMTRLADVGSNRGREERAATRTWSHP